MSKSKKIILKVFNLNASLVKAKVAVSYVRLFADNTSEKRLYVFDTQDTAKLKSARTFKEFTSVANKVLLVEHLDAQARKAMLTKNTHYDKIHTSIARLLNKTDFVASNDRAKKEVKSTLSKMLKAKKTAKKTAKASK